jgi:hypothetical protein
MTNVMLVGLAGATDTLYLEFNTDINQKTEIASKTYDFIETGSTPNTLRQGYVYQGNSIMGSILVCKSQHVKYKHWIQPIADGTVKLTTTGSSYSIVLDSHDFYGNSIKSDFTGSLKYIDESASKAPSVFNGTYDKIDEIKKYLKRNSSSN